LEILMGLSYNFPLNSSPGAPTISRDYILSFPIDWWAAARVAPLPVLVFFHGGNGSADNMMKTQFRIDDWWTRSFGGVHLKAIAFALQGVSLSSQAGGAWDSAHLGTINLMAGSDDELAFFDALDRAEQQLKDYFNTYVQPAVGGALLNQVFNRNKLLPVGFSVGGAFTYRIAAVAASHGWTVPAACVFSSTTGGWRTETERLAAPTVPQVEWLPAVPGSLLHICGFNDDHCAPTNDGTSSTDVNSVLAENLLPTNDWANSDTSGRNSALEYAALAAAQPGWVTTAPVSPPAAIPNMMGGVATLFDNVCFDTTGGATPNLQICCARLGMGHEIPPFAADAVIQFFRRWGGL
jgi:hypothetical protein